MCKSKDVLQCKICLDIILKVIRCIKNKLGFSFSKNRRAEFFQNADGARIHFSLSRLQLVVVVQNKIRINFRIALLWCFVTFDTGAYNLNFMQQTIRPLWLTHVIVMCGGWLVTDHQWRSRFLVKIFINTREQ